MTKKPFPTQARLHELLERHYDSDGRLYFVAKVARGKKVKAGDILFGTPVTKNRGKSSECVRFLLGVDGYSQNIAVWNMIYEYGDYDRNVYTVDHEDRNPLNDHHTNLRLLTRSGQNKNRNNYKKKNSSSIYHGVYFHKPSNQWMVRYYDKNMGKMQHIGYYTDESEAAIAYDETSWSVNKDLGKLNFPENYMN